MIKTILPLCCVGLAAGLGAYASPPWVRLTEGDRKAEAISVASSELARMKIPGRNGAQTDVPQTRLGENTPLIPPFCETFDNFRPGMAHDDFARYFQVIDANNDNRYWGLYAYNGPERPYGCCAYMHFPVDIPADDWLLTRAIKLEGGKYYRISVDASLYMDDLDNTPQVFEVKCGMYNDAEGMSTLVIPATSVGSSKFRNESGWFVPPFDGKYYVGVHGISPVYDSYYNYLFIDNISVDAARESTVPSDVTDMELSNDPDGSTRIDIRFNAPEVDLAGVPLQGDLCVKVFRDGEEIRSIEDVAPGAACSLSDTPGAEGYYRYSFRVSNSSGEGADVIVDRYAGIAAPAAPVVFHSEETAGHGLHCKWTVPDVDVNGNPINKQKILFDVYDVSDGQPVLAVSDLKEPEFTLEFPDAASGQRFAMMLVRAVFDGKESEEAVSDMLAVGPPDVLPYHNSFTAEDYYKYLLSVELKKDATWRFLDDLSDPKAQDGDGGYVAMICNIPGGSCELQTGKIDFSGATLPSLSFYTYVYEMDENEINIKITDMSDGSKETVSTVYLSSFPHAGWNKVVCPLGDYAGKTVSVVIEGVVRTHGYIPVDNMTIAQLPDVDLAVGEIDYPRGVPTGEPFDIFATVHNNGLEETSAYSVCLKRDGKIVGTAEGFSVGSLDSVEIVLTDVLTPMAQTGCVYTVEIDAPGDGCPEDNVSDPFRIEVVVPTYPAVTDLRCSGAAEDVRLEWSAPDPATGGPEAVLEDFEAYSPFDTAFGDWLTFDGDGGYVGGFSGIEMPVDGTCQSWWVMSDDDPFGFIWPYSGRNLLVQMYCLSADGRSEVPCQDWLISPELFGGRQTVSFWASSLTGDYGLETMEVYWSEGGTDPSDFRIIMEECEVSAEWTRYFVGLPVGARRFAIKVTTPAGYMLKLDDMEYVPSGIPVSVELLGYNIYRNGEIQNASPVQATSFATTQTGENDAYFVTAVYDRGESVASNVVGFGNASVGVIGEDSDASVRYYNLQGLPLDPSDLAPGIYVRVRGSVAEKIIVR